MHVVPSERKGVELGCRAASRFKHVSRLSLVVTNESGNLGLMHMSAEHDGDLLLNDEDTKIALGPLRDLERSVVTNVGGGVMQK